LILLFLSIDSDVLKMRHTTRALTIGSIELTYYNDNTPSLTNIVK